MPTGFFNKTFKNLQMPVIVCENVENYPLVFANTSARLLCNPLLTIEKLKKGTKSEYFSEFMQFQKPEGRDAFFNSLKSMGAVSGYKASLLTVEDEPFVVYLSSNFVSFNDREFFVIYVNESDSGGKLSYSDVDHTISTAFQIAYHTVDIDEAINKILGLVGTYADVSRAYVFEETSYSTVSNTYEWSNDSVEPLKKERQDAAKENYNYNEILHKGMHIVDDIRTLPHMDRIVLEKKGIKSLAIITLYGPDRPIGYIGFDDNSTYRKWGSSEIQLLKGISSVVVSLIMKRNAFSQTQKSYQLFQAIMDKQEALIYANDVNSYELIFVNKAFESAMNVNKNKIIGRKCYEIINDVHGITCENCPIEQLKKDDGSYSEESYIWEFENKRTGKWYMSKDSIFSWIDDRFVHIQNAAEITNTKKYEQELEYYASTDSLTGVHNRDWGFKAIGQTLLNPSRDPEKKSSLVFIDIDGLKDTNDRFGHDAGDNMIIETVNIIRSVVRQSDLIFRWGGDEFILVLDGVGDSAERVMQKINDHLDIFNKKYNLPYRLSFSYGITEFDSESGEDIDSIISRADKLMFQQKSSKKNLKL